MCGAKLWVDTQNFKIGMWIYSELQAIKGCVHDAVPRFLCFVVSKSWLLANIETMAPEALASREDRLMGMGFQTE